MKFVIWILTFISMYYYIYDQFLSQKKYDKILTQIESKITDLGIKDRIIKMSILKSVKELVTDAIRKGAKNIIAVGNDQTINQVVNLVANQEVIVGIIPIDKINNRIANFLGIDDPLEACEIIAARKVETINLGEVNNDYFINSIKIHDNNLTLNCDEKFKLSLTNKNNLISIYNFSPEFNTNLNDQNFFNPKDVFLEVIVERKPNASLDKFFQSLLKTEKKQLPESIFRVKKINIKNPLNKSGSVLVDNFKILKTPLDIKISTKKLKIIVGKKRKF